MGILMKGVRKAFNGVPVLSIEDLEIPKGGQWVVTGTSGSGKTTFLNIASGILTPDQGSVRVAGTEITTLAEADRDRFRAVKIGFVFQTFNLLQGFTALENVLLGMLFAGKTDSARAESLLERVGLKDRMGYLPTALSVGQQQRVAIARAIVADPLAILADEPTGNLDREAAAATLHLLSRLNAEFGSTLLMVTHDPLAADAAGRVIHLDKGRITDDA